MFTVDASYPQGWMRHQQLGLNFWPLGLISSSFHIS
jgi:hypothetical protein